MRADRYWTVVVIWAVMAAFLLVTGCAAPAPQTVEKTLNTEENAQETADVDTEEEAAEPIELVVWSELFVVDKMQSDPTGAGRYGLYLKEQFEKEHPGVTVKFEYHGWDKELRRNLTTALQTGTAPDIVVGENFFQQYAEQGALVPLDDVIDDIRDDLIPATYRAAQYQGSVYGISAFTGIFGFERNCDVVTAAGLDCDNPPETWDELLEHARLITEEGDGRYYGYTLQGPQGFEVGGVFRIAVYLAQAGASMCKDDCTYPYFNDPKAVAVMEFIRELNKYTPPGLTFNPDEGQVYTQLFHGLAAYQIAGSWHPGWAKEAGCEDCRYSPVPIPAGGEPASMVVGNVIYAVLQQSEHPGLAAEWVKFLARDDVQDLVYPVLGRLPSTRSALTRLRPKVDPANRAFIDELLNNQELGVLPQWRKDPQKLWRIYNDMLTEILTSQRPVQQIMDEAQAAADEVMQQ
ncbi:MAG: sn-glycerol-3-phosphate-binding periplasmic protein UgpB [Anaerolineales bacterium]|nr:sn-glycerol-3-phosphate-binding periplasmic protein UgpB [Anaerolineales bacterium]